MSDNWKLIADEVHTYRNYVNALDKKAKDHAAFSYLLTKEEFNRLLSLKGDGTQLDGVRIYLGGQIIDGHLIAKVHVVPAEKHGADYTDFGVPATRDHIPAHPDTAPHPQTLVATATAGGGGSTSTGTTFPCPAFCGGSNILNS